MLPRITNTARLGIKNLYQLNHIKSFHNATVAHKAQVMNDQSQYVVKTDRIYSYYDCLFNYTNQLIQLSLIELVKCYYIHVTLTNIQQSFQNIHMYFMRQPSLYQFIFGLQIHWTQHGIINIDILNILEQSIYICTIIFVDSQNVVIDNFYLILEIIIHLIQSYFKKNTLANDKNVYWFETYQFHPLTADLTQFDDRDNADYLSEQGQLIYELACQLDHIQELGTAVQDEVIYFMKDGIVHHPELFEAATKGYVIDTSNFVINTAHNIRAFEGHHNQ